MQWTDVDVKKMREYRKQGMSYKDLSLTFGGAISTVYRACHGKTYKHVGGPVEGTYYGGGSRPYYRSVQ